MSDKPVAGELWMRDGREEYYFINSIYPRYSHFNQDIDCIMIHFTVIRDGEKTFDADTDMDNFIKCTKKVKQ